MVEKAETIPHPADWWSQMYGPMRQFGQRVAEFFAKRCVGRHLADLERAGEHVILRVVAVSVTGCLGAFAVMAAREHAARNHQCCRHRPLSCGLGGIDPRRCRDQRPLPFGI